MLGAAGTDVIAVGCLFGWDRGRGGGGGRRSSSSCGAWSLQSSSSQQSAQQSDPRMYFKTSTPVAAVAAREALGASTLHWMDIAWLSQELVGVQVQWLGGLWLAC